MKYRLIFTVIYFLTFLLWIYIRFWKNKKEGANFKVKNNGGNLIVEQDQKKIIINHDVLKNKVLLEFQEEGIVFKVVDGLFKEPPIIEDSQDYSSGIVNSDVLDDLHDSAENEMSKIEMK